VEEQSLRGDSSSDWSSGDGSGLSYGMNSGSADLLLEAVVACRVGDGGGDASDLGTVGVVVTFGLDRQRVGSADHRSLF
jgi:hypothetical protein